MSSGGMNWAYRMIAAHDLDPLGVAVVLHLGWRDTPNQRTDKGIARALHQHVSSVRKATAKLAALGLIARRSGQWVACETVAIVTEAPEAPRPGKASADAPEEGCHSVAPPVPLSGTPKCHSVAPKRKENFENARRRAARPSRRPAATSAKAHNTDRSAVVRRALGPLADVPSRLVGKRREFQGPDGHWYARPVDPEEALRFEAWCLNGTASPDRRAS